ncbi:hypothetical protein DH2020_033194 [Rehmannia glutinosa]|uniref:Cellulose synthase-like protein n=1 Tax=Rehmannia glutinosa TaxID=99300 RepID=A0ABR0VFP6_REHGL
MTDNFGEEDVLPLFETKTAKGRAAYKLYCLIVLFGIVLIWAYRLVHIPGAGERGRYAWMAMFFAEVLFGVYWIITQACRWHVVYRYPFKDRLSTRYYLIQGQISGVDIFVCTADPTLEPPLLVINTVLSVMSYNYPSHKLGVFLSDDGCSELTFYALLEASKFSKYWIPFCKKYNVEPRAPEIYFAQNTDLHESNFAQEWTSVKNHYEDMKRRIDSAGAKGCIPEEIKDEHKGFSEWNSRITKQDHQSIVQILIDGGNPQAVDIDGNKLPMLVYLSREKRPGCAHNFKAGSMNALIRVSSEISNAPIILNLDCDMYSNDPDAIRDALCFFLDEKQGQQTSCVQYPQRYSNVTKNDVYANVSNATIQIELAGLDGFGGTLYIGTGCFHRRESLSGKYYENRRLEWTNVKDNTKGRTVEELEEASKPLADCSYEKGTLWGKEMGLVYGCSVEDIVTGLTIQCRGWKPVYYNPTKIAFQGVGSTTLDVALIQFKRWSEGMFQIFLSKYCPLIYGRGKTQLGAQMGYCIYLLWAPVSLPTLCYVVIPALYLLHDVPLFPQLVVRAICIRFSMRTAYSIVEDLLCGGTLRGWWNLQRMLLIRRTTSYFFAFIDTIYKQLGLSETSFAVTDKVVDDEVQKRYEKEIIEFGSSSTMFLMIATLALVNLFSLGYGIMKVYFSGQEALVLFMVQITISGMIVMVNLPVYEALFLRRDKGRIPSSVLFKATHVNENEKLAWIGMFGAEIWFGLYWILTQAHRWNRIYRQTFKDRLSQRYENDLPGVDIFVCTADPKIEPPMMVINTVLSVMAYDYPPEKLSVYLSDDGGSDLTFYALLEASHFAKHWIPYCKKYNVEPRSPEAHFRSESEEFEASQAQHLASVKKLYQVMENKIELATKLGRISKSALLEHKGFANWDSFVSQKDHDAILQILIDGRDAEAKDIEDCRLPTLVYLSREKRPQHFHNFKAGAMNALLRVSSEISNGPVILNLDCDMYSNNSQSIRDALCFFLDEQKSHEFAYVQFPQNFHNLTKNELYGGSMRVVADVEFHGLDGYGGPLYVGTGCFHRRDTLCGRKFTKGSSMFEWKGSSVPRTGESVIELEERIKELASCTIEKNTQWGQEMGLKYGCPVEDVITGLSIQCRGWKSVYFNPERNGFLGVGTTTLDQTLVQHKRWSEGDLQIFLSKYSPIWYGLGRIKFGLIMGYCAYCLWSINCFATLYYSTIPALYLLRAKVSDQDVSQRYEQEKMEFGAISPMFTILSSLAMLNLFCLVRMVTKVVWAGGFGFVRENMGLQILLSGVLVLINLPLYDAAFFRKDKGRMPSSVTLKSALVALSLCTIYDLLW